MGRPSNREQRRVEIVTAFARVFAQHGYAGATISAVAAEAGMSPGLLHHHFVDKDDMLSGLLEELVTRFRQRLRSRASEGNRLDRYVSAALALDARADVEAARCWVGLLAEAVRNPALFKRVKRIIDAEIDAIQQRSAGRLDAQGASAVLAFVLGALVLGAFAPKRTAGFAAPALRELIAVMTRVPSSERR